MFSGNWCNHAPLGAGIAAVAILLLIAGLLNNSNYRQRGDGRAEQHAKHALESVKDAGVPVVGRHEPPPPNPEPKREEWRQEQDLQAQRQMADWAKYAVFAAIASAVITAMGVWYVAQTLKATRDAVRETAKATQATERAVEVQVRIEQPLLFVERIETRLDPPDEEYRIKKIGLLVRNVGKGPAILTEWTVECAVVPALPEVPVYSSVAKLRGSLIQRDEKAEYPVYFADDEADAIAVRQETVHLWGYFLYEDVFGRLRKTGFGYVGHPFGGVSSGLFAGVLWARAGGTAYNYDREEDT